MLHFYRLWEKKPEYGMPILIKYKDYDFDWNKREYVYIGDSYYVVRRTEDRYYNRKTDKYEYKDTYIEAWGEEYAEFEVESILGWCYLEDIKKVEEWSDGKGQRCEDRDYKEIIRNF